MKDGMSSERWRKTLRVAVLIALMGLLAAPRGLVLCVGNSGHVSIEAALEIAPCQPVPDDTRFESESTETCKDAPLGSTALKSTGEPEIVSASVAILAQLPRLPAISRPLLPSTTTLSASSLWLRQHRTIVLLV